MRRDEIATEFRDAAAIALTPGDREHFLRIAKQVNAMRCESCNNYDKQHQLCEVVGGSELLIPSYFGCFHHEPKEPDCSQCNGECHADCDEMRSAPATGRNAHKD